MKDSPVIPAKILMTADTVGGVWSYALQLCNALEGTTIHLATMGAPLSKRQWQQVADLKNVIIHESNYKLEWMPDPWDDISASGTWLLQLEREIRPDLVHLNNYAHGALRWDNPVLMVAHSCVLSWWKAVKRTAPPAGWDTYARKVREGLLKADLVVSVSKDMQQALEENYGALPCTEMIYNGAEQRQFFAAPKEEYIFAMGRIWDEAKNLFVLEEIAGELPWPILLAGENKDPANGNIREFQAVQLAGTRSSVEIAVLLAHAPIYVMPAKYEPFGLSVLEAGLSGCALVLGDIPSLREIWQDAAVFVHPEDHEQLKVALLKLIRDKRLRQMLSARAVAQARKYSTGRMSVAYHDTYASLLMKKNLQARKSAIL